VVQTLLVAVDRLGQPSGDGQAGDQPAEIHAGERSDQSSANQPEDKRSDAPADKLSFEPPIYKRLLKPLVYGEPADHQTPKNALITTDTSTRKRQEPPQPMSSLLMSWSPEFHLM